MKNLKIHKYKLIKTYPTSPELGTILTFYEHQKVRYTMEGITNNPEFWKDVSNGDVEEEVNKIFQDCTEQYHYSNTDWDEELNIPVCKKKIVEYIKQLLNEKISDL